MQLPDIDNIIQGKLADPKVGEQVSEDEEDGPGDGADPEDDVFWIVVGGGGDPGVGERGLMVEDLGEPVAEEDGGDRSDRGKEREEIGWEFT
jgi:hypothetical protein